MKEVEEEPEWMTLEDLREHIKSQRKSPAKASKATANKVKNSPPSQYVPAVGSQSLEHFKNNVQLQPGQISPPLIQDKAQIQHPGIPEIGDTAKNKKRHIDSEDIPDTLLSKRRKLISRNESSLSRKVPMGLKWDRENYSCAYDSLFSILKAYYQEADLSSKLQLKMNSCPLLQHFWNEIEEVIGLTKTFEEARDFLRAQLHRHNARDFPLTGTAGTDIYSLCKTMLDNMLPQCSWYTKCTRCDFLTVAQKRDPIIYLQRSLLHIPTLAAAVCY